jgi:hypothetical protein
VSGQDWAGTLEPGVSDAFVFFRGISLDGREAWLDARDCDQGDPRWSDLDPS